MTSITQVEAIDLVEDVIEAVVILPPYRR